VDTTKICDASGSFCHENNFSQYPDLPTHDENITYYMLSISLVKSTIFHAIQLLGGRALVAEDKLQRRVSLPLEEEQWKVEAENLFQASLARIQFQLKDHILGAAATNPDYTNRSLAGMHDMCDMYKFRGQGWKNVSMWGMLILNLLVAVVYCLGFEVQGFPMFPHRCDEEFEGRQNDTQEYQECCARKTQQKTMVVEWIFDAIFGPASTKMKKIETETKSQGAVSNGGLGQTSPRICLSGLSHDERLTPENLGTPAGQDMEVSPYPSHVYEQGSSPTGEDAVTSEDDEGSHLSTSESNETRSTGSFYRDLCDLTIEDLESGQLPFAPVLDPFQKAIVARVMEEFWIIFDREWGRGFKECASTSSSSQNSSSACGITNVGGSTSNQKSQFGPRKRQRDDDRLPDRDENRNSRPPRQRAGPSDGPRVTTRFACPFRKHNSLTYNIYNYRICSLSHWGTIARVK